MTAGLFPIIHAGRMWFAYWLLPYPNERFLWPNFKSPARLGRVRDLHLPDHQRGVLHRRPRAGHRRPAGRRHRLEADASTRSCRWAGRAPTASGATTGAPTASSPRSPRRWSSPSTAWCRGTSRWRSCRAGTRRSSRPSSSTAPSSPASRWSSILLLPMRLLLQPVRLHHGPAPGRHGEADPGDGPGADLLLRCEVFTAWYSGEPLERACFFSKAVEAYAWACWWLQYLLQLRGAARLLLEGRAHPPATLYVVSILVLIGMWLERFNIIVPGLGHDFYPYTWGTYSRRSSTAAIIIGCSPGSSSCSWASSG